MTKKAIVLLAVVSLLLVSLLWAVTGSITDYTLGTSRGNPASGRIRLWSNTATGNFECLTSSGGICYFGQAGTFATQTDGATVTWAIASVLNASAILTFTVHSGNRTLNITNPAINGNYVLELIQDGIGGEGLILGTGCTWKVISGGSGAITLSTGANALDVLTFTYDGTNCLANLGKNYN